MSQGRAISENGLYLNKKILRGSMSMTNQKNMISSEEARIMLLEQKNDDFHQALMRIEKRFDCTDNKLDSIDKKFESKFENIDKKFDKMNDKIDSHFRWTISLIFGLYATAFATLLGAVGKAYHWF